MHRLSFIIGLVLWFVAAPAYAQFTANQTNVQGDGLRISDRLRLHGFANADMRYDTNPALQPAQVSPQGDISLRGRGGFKLDFDSDVVPVTFNGQADYTRYLGISSAQLTNLSAFQAAAGLSVGFNPEGWISGTFTDQFARTETGSQIVVGDTIRSIRNTARAAVKLKPGGGALEFNAGYGFDFLLFDENQRSLPEARALSNYSHLLVLNALWRFFPRTALALEVDQGFTRYFFLSTLIPNVAVNPFRVKVGINGQVTDHISIRASAGYGNSFTSGGPSFSSVVVGAGVTWTPTETLQFGLGYTRDVLPVSLFGYFSNDRVTFEYKQTFVARVSTMAKLEYAHESYGRPLIAGLSSRNDDLIRGEARVSVQLLSFLATGVFYMPEVRLTNYRAPVTNISGQYMRHLFGIDVTVGY